MVGKQPGPGRMDRADSAQGSQRARDHREGSDAGGSFGRLGPGLLESVYTACLCRELEPANPAYERQVSLAVYYEDVRLACGYRTDIIVAQDVILEIKSIEHILPLHEAQVLTYLRPSGCKLGLLRNFNTVLLKNGLLQNGLRRFIP